MSKLDILKQLIELVKPEELDQVNEWIDRVQKKLEAPNENHWEEPEFELSESVTKSGKKEYIKKSRR